LLSQQSELDMGALPPPALMAAEEPPAYNAGGGKAPMSSSLC
jgi:hypothetical protein